MTIDHESPAITTRLEHIHLYAGTFHRGQEVMASCEGENQGPQIVTDQIGQFIERSLPQIAK